uniref:Uncharacterized protein n=1 Tax=Cucumis melo TaxID=3656 RepID=A0A9I9DAM7_CUCME
MAEVLAGVSQASLFFRPRLGGTLRSNKFSVKRLQFQSTIGRGISFDCKTVVSAIRATDSKNEDIDIYPDTTGGDSSDKGIGGGGSGGGDGGRGDNEGNSGEGEESNADSRKKALSMSQKLTLGYAALVGAPLEMGEHFSGRIDFSTPYSLKSEFPSSAASFFLSSELGGDHRTPPRTTVVPLRQD